MSIEQRLPRVDQISWQNSHQARSDAVSGVLSYPFASLYRDGGGDGDPSSSLPSNPLRQPDRSPLTYAQLKELDASL